MSINAMTVSAGDALNVLKTGWEMQQKTGEFISYMMHGRPGIGKTQVGESLARFIGGRLYDMRLTTIEPSDLRGMPHYDHDNKLTVWYRPEDLPNTDEPAVLFFDELTAASPFLQPTVYGILQERRIGQHKIPDNTIIVAAGNTVDDGAVAYEMGTAISDRLLHMHVEADVKDWIKNYAIPNNLHPAVIAFLESRPDLFETTQDALKQGHMIAATPRSWKRMSDIMYALDGGDRKIRDIMAAGTLGNHISHEFGIIADDIAQSVKVSEMIETPREKRLKMYPTTMHGLNAMVFGVIATITRETLEPCCEILVDMGNLDTLRSADKEYRSLPLREIETYAFETLMEKLSQSQDMGYEDLTSSPAFDEHMTARIKDGLSPEL